MKPKYRLKICMLAGFCSIMLLYISNSSLKQPTHMTSGIRYFNITKYRLQHQKVTGKMSMTATNLLKTELNISCLPVNETVTKTLVDWSKDTKGEKRTSHPRDDSSTCASDLPQIEGWVESILKEFSIKCGLKSIQRLAVESSTNRSASKHTSMTISKVHEALKTWKRRPNPNSYQVNEVNKSDSMNRPSLGFIKAYKVGGTLMSSLLNAYAYSYNLNRNPNWPIPAGKQETVCAHIVGTDHPANYFYQNIISQRIDVNFCDKPLVFMLVRDPIERIWSGYNHVRKTTLHQSRFYPMKEFLLQKHPTIAPPYQLLSHNVRKAIELSQNILMLSSDEGNMDLSLILLSKKAGLGLCDILYAPCSGSEIDWAASKCNDKKLNLNKASRDDIIRHLSSSDESKFYNTAMEQFKNSILMYDKCDLKRTLKKYLSIRKEAQHACSTNLSQQAWESVFMADPRTKYNEESKKWTLTTDNVYVVHPLWVCMQMYCKDKYEQH